MTEKLFREPTEVQDALANYNQERADDRAYCQRKVDEAIKNLDRFQEQSDADRAQITKAINEYFDNAINTSQAAKFELLQLSKDLQAERRFDDEDVLKDAQEAAE